MNAPTLRLLLFLTLSLRAAAQTFDFEPGDKPWTRDPSFATQPIDAASITTGRIGKFALGGNYWRDLHFPLGQHAAHLIATAEGNLGDAATGVLLSPEFPITRDNRWLSLLIGGTNDPAYEVVELQLNYAGEFFTTWSATGRTEALQQETYRIPDAALGRTARIRIVDASPHGHINIDYIRLTAAPPDSHRTPVWGYADYHTHPMTYLAFGALQDTPQHAIWGNPGGSFADYADLNRISCDLPHCVLGHNGGIMSELFLDMAQSVSTETFSKWTLRSFLPHPHAGGPEFTNFPSFYRGAHQQMHITQIHRNYEGGLRLMVGLVADNLGAEYLTSRTHKGQVHPAAPQKSLEAQICGMLHMAELNKSWMEIAYTAEQARSIILQDKLAVIMGVEMDQLLELDPDHPRTPAQEVEYLWKLGVRAVTPIHAINNKIGGPAVFIDAYNWDNDLVHRNKLNSTPGDLNKDTNKAIYFDVKDDTAPLHRGETVLFRFEPAQQRVALLRLPGSLFRLTPFIVPATEEKYTNGNHALGHKNTQGLTDPGREYLSALMAKGMIVDTAHMSDESVTDTQQWMAEKSREYPAIVSHAHFRAQTHYETGAPSDLQPSEYDISDSNLKWVKAVGGVVGPFTSQATIESDCAMSSKTFGSAVHFAVERLGTGIGMATDFTFISGVSPRFGPDACAGYKARPSLKYEMKRPNHERHHNPGGQIEGIVYDRLEQSHLKLGRNPPLTPYTMGDHTYNFNLEGLAHYGLIPDLLQDLKNVDPHAIEDLQALFSSSEDYLRMWEKAERLSTCNASNAFCNPVPPTPKCGLPAAPACRL